MSDYRSVFQRHGVHQTLGLTVLHRHFDLETGEKLVEFNAVTAPWRMPDSPELLLDFPMPGKPIGRRTSVA